MYYLKYFLIMCCVCLTMEARAAPIKVDFAVSITDKREFNFQTEKYTYTHLSNPIEGKLSLLYDTKNTEDVASGNDHTYYNDNVHWTVAINPFFSGAGGGSVPLMSINQQQVPNSGQYSSGFGYGSASHPPGFFIFSSQPLLVSGLGVENFFNAALASRHEFSFDYDDNLALKVTGGAVVTGVTTVPLPGAIWFLGTGLLALAVPTLFKSRRNLSPDSFSC